MPIYGQNCQHWCCCLAVTIEAIEGFCLYCFRPCLVIVYIVYIKRKALLWVLTALSIHVHGPVSVFQKPILSYSSVKWVRWHNWYIIIITCGSSFALISFRRTFNHHSRACSNHWIDTKNHYKDWGWFLRE